MKSTLTFKILTIASILLIAAFLFSYESDDLVDISNGPPQEMSVVNEASVQPIEHASFVMRFAGQLIFNDPVGDSALYKLYGVPDIVLVSDIHGDHLDLETLEAVIGEGTLIVASQAVSEQFPEFLTSQSVTMGNGDQHEVEGLKIEAVPMYNLPESEDSFHTKGRGNGYVLEGSGMRMYIAGDTADIPEMRALEDIDIAFIPMNLPFTMDVDIAADAVLDFAPAVVYPYHYRGKEGFSDVDEFIRLVELGNEEIEVRALNWYPR